MSKIALQEVKVGDRLREDHGDIEGLAASLEKHGLIHAIVIDAENNLVCGGRRLAAAESLGWDEIEYRDFGSLTEKERRLIELEENIRRKDLTSYERSRKTVELVETAAELLREEAASVPEELTFCAESAQKSVGRPEGTKEPGSLRDVAERINVPAKTIHDAKRHVEVADEHPVFQNPSWKQYHVLEAREHLHKIPEPDRAQAVALISEPGIPSGKAIGILKNLSRKDEAERAEIFELRKSDDSRERTLALTKAAELPPVPDPRVTKLDGIARELRAAATLFPNDPFNERLKALANTAKTLSDEIHSAYRERVTQ